VATYYIAPGGSDGAAGGLASPWATLARGLAATGPIGPGDLRVIRGATYAQSLIGPGLKSGTSWASPIRIQAYPTETVWFKPTSGFNVMEFSVDEQYLEFDTVHVDATGGVDKGAIAVVGWSGGVGHHIRWKNSKIACGGANPYSQGRMGIGCGASQATMLANNEWLTLEIYGTRSGATPEWGIYLESSNNVASDCRLHDFVGGAYKVSDGWGYQPVGNQLINPIIYNVSGAP